MVASVKRVYLPQKNGDVGMKINNIWTGIRVKFNT